MLLIRLIADGSFSLFEDLSEARECFCAPMLEAKMASEAEGEENSGESRRELVGNDEGKYPSKNK